MPAMWVVYQDVSFVKKVIQIQKLRLDWVKQKQNIKYYMLISPESCLRKALQFGADSYFQKEKQNPGKFKSRRGRLELLKS